MPTSEHPAGVRAGGSGNRCAHVGLGAGADLGGVRPFPDDDPWNTDISAFPVHPLSDEIKASMGDSVIVGLRAEFGATPYRGARPGIPYVVVPEEQPLVPIKFTTYGGPPGPIRFRLTLPSRTKDFRRRTIATATLSSSSATLRRHQLPGHALRTVPRRTSEPRWRFRRPVARGQRRSLQPQRAVAALARDLVGGRGWAPDLSGARPLREVARAVAEDGKKGVIPHALRFTVAPGFTRWATVAPATRCAGWGAGKVPFGSRWRLRADWPVPDEWSAQVNVIINTLKRYGMIMADNGGQFFISGAPDERWEDLWLRHLLYISGDNLDMVDTGPITACTP